MMGSPKIQMSFITDNYNQTLGKNSFMLHVCTLKRVPMESGVIIIITSTEEILRLAHKYATSATYFFLNGHDRHLQITITGRSSLTQLVIHLDTWVYIYLVSAYLE